MIEKRAEILITVRANHYTTITRAIFMQGQMVHLHRAYRQQTNKISFISIYHSLGKTKLWPINKSSEFSGKLIFNNTLVQLLNRFCTLRLKTF